MKTKKKKKLKKPFQVGDKILDFGQVYRIFKIKNKKGPRGKSQKSIFFRPYFKTPQNKSTICSIPIKNLKKAKIRRPISKRELQKLIRKLSRDPRDKKPIATAKAKEALNKNDPFKTAQVLKKLWLDKIDESTNFTRAKKDVFNLAIKRLVEEVAYVSNTSITKAQLMIKTSLKKLGKAET
jgi:RNA polymerase-interacting CarD/CdnL/TRCF family regulator